MACCGSSQPPLLLELEELVNQIGNSCNNDTPCSCCSPSPCCQPTYCAPCDFPYAQVVMTTPPPCLAPTRPEPVKPLQLPCCCKNTGQMSLEEREASRYDNFYNMYNINWHTESPSYRCKKPPAVCTPEKQRGQAVDGKSPCCDECPPPPCDNGCPTGFKPCTMRLTPPPFCHPLAPWCAEIQPCAAKKKVEIYPQPTGDGGAPCSSCD